MIIFRLSSEASLIYLPFSFSTEALKEPTVAEDRWLVVPRNTHLRNSDLYQDSGQ